MKKNIMLIIALLLLCCGCSTSYTITVNEDLSVTEVARPMADSEFFQEYEHSSAQRVIGLMLRPHLDYLNKNGFKIKEVYEAEEAGVLISNEYETIEDYIEISELPKQYGNELKYSKTDGVITLRISGQFSGFSQDQSSNKYEINDGKITVKLINRTAIDHNADEVNEDEHTYTWNIENNLESRELFISFNEEVDKIFPLYEVIAVATVGILIIVAIFISIKVSNLKKLRNEV